MRVTRWSTGAGPLPQTFPSQIPHVVLWIFLGTLQALTFVAIVPSQTVVMGEILWVHKQFTQYFVTGTNGNDYMLGMQDCYQYAKSISKTA